MPGLDFVEYGQDDVPFTPLALDHPGELAKAPLAGSIIRRDNRDRDLAACDSPEEIRADLLADAELVVVPEHGDPGVDEAVIEVVGEAGAGVPAPEAQENFVVVPGGRRSGFHRDGFLGFAARYRFLLLLLLPKETRCEHGEKD